MNYYSVSSLEVIGVTEVPALQPPLPRVLSTIFREQSSGKILYPPYLLDGNALLNPVAATREDFNERVDLGEITRCDPEPAKTGWAYWLDDEGNIHYEPLSLITRKLADIFEKHRDSARRKLASREFAAARDHALIAAATHPLHLDPLILRAAAEHCMKQHRAEFPDADIELELTEELASEYLGIDAFREEYLREVARFIPPVSKICGVATKESATARCFAASSSPTLALAA